MFYQEQFISCVYLNLLTNDKLAHTYEFTLLI